VGSDVAFDVHALIEDAAKKSSFSKVGQQELRNMLCEYKDVFATSQFDVGEFKEPWSEFRIELNCPEEVFRQRGWIRMRPVRDEAKNKEMVRQSHELEKRGYISRCKGSAFASPSLLVKKPQTPDESRLCIDFRNLNAHTVKDRYPIRAIDPMLRRLAKGVYFSSFDMRGGYYHCRIHKESIHLTAFHTPAGLFVMNRLSFGFANGPPHFQRCMDKGYGEIEGSEIYLDDLVNGAINEPQALEQARQLLQRTKELNVKLNLKKCEFGRKTVAFLGHKISHGKLIPNKEYQDKVLHMRRPETKKELLTYLGAVGWLQKFIPRLAYKTNALSKLRKKNAIFVWTPECQRDFQDIQEAVRDANYLHIADESKDFILFCDASVVAFGATLCQKVGDLNEDEEITAESDEDPKFVPIAYMCGRFTDSELNWTVPEKEMYAVVRALKKWRHYCLPGFTIIYTDARDVYWLLQPLRKHDNSRLAKWAMSLMEYSFRAVHIAGKKNEMADYLSRYVPRLTCLVAFGVVKNGIYDWNGINNVSELCEVKEVLVDGEYKWTACVRTLPAVEWTLPTDDPTLPTVEGGVALPVASEEEEKLDEASKALKKSLQGHLDQFEEDQRRREKRAKEELYVKRMTEWEEEEIWDPIFNEKVEDGPELDAYLRKSALQDLRPELAQELTWEKFIAYSEEDYICRILKKCLKGDNSQRWELPTSEKRNLKKGLYKIDAEHDVLVTRDNQRVVPAKMRIFVLKFVHYSLNGGHQGARRMTNRIIMAKPRTSEPRYGEMQPWVATRFGEVIHVDIVGPLPVTASGNRYILTVMDRFTGYVQAYAIPNASSEQIAQTLLNNWIFIYGIPESILSDRGSDFLSELMKCLCDMLSIVQKCTTAYHPQTNGKLERFHRTLKMRLRTIGIDRGIRFHRKSGAIHGVLWDNFLSPITFGYNTTKMPQTQTAPWKLVFARDVQWQSNKQLRLARDKIEPLLTKKTARKYLKKLYKALKEVNYTHQAANEEVIRARVERANRKRSPHNFEVGDICLVSDSERKVGNERKFCPYWVGPYVITEICSERPNNVKLANLLYPEKKQEVYNVERLKRIEEDCDPSIRQLVKSYYQDKA
jgi:transposase InsO family protein